ncbi:MAG: carboxymuconolactone decarboxylase family protein [Phycisphaerales bacterium]
MATTESLEQYRARRAAGMERLLSTDHLGIKRYLALDSAAYRDGALDAKTKELLGLVASAVLRCDSCVTYHLETAVEHGWTREEIVDALNVALVVGGTITIPHMRDAILRLDEILAEHANTSPKHA